MNRVWKEAREKVDAEAGCRVCGYPHRVEAAHVTGRVHDRPKTPGAKTVYVAPDSVVPLCRDHHTQYDAHNLDLLPHLFKPEQLRAVEDLGLSRAYQRLTSSKGDKP